MSEQNKIVLINEEQCIGCGNCVDMCPKKILYLEPETGKCKVSNEKLCDRLAGCQRACPVAAIKIIK
jgi:NAD-dependent dihydropyrimidine dehydrogenase PreA subunit